MEQFKSNQSNPQNQRFFKDLYNRDSFIKEAQQLQLSQSVDYGTKTQSPKFTNSNSEDKIHQKKSKSSKNGIKAYEKSLSNSALKLRESLDRKGNTFISDHEYHSLRD